MDDFILTDEDISELCKKRVNNFMNAWNFFKDNTEEPVLSGVIRAMYEVCFTEGMREYRKYIEFITHEQSTHQF